MNTDIFQRWLYSLLARTYWPTRANDHIEPVLGDTGRERGDVPGWVMITMMTAIVVIALLTVFQDAVIGAVTNAFDSITKPVG